MNNMDTIKVHQIRSLKNIQVIHQMIILKIVPHKHNQNNTLTILHPEPPITNQKTIRIIQPPRKNQVNHIQKQQNHQALEVHLQMKNILMILILIHMNLLNLPLRVLKGGLKEDLKNIMKFQKR